MVLWELPEVLRTVLSSVQYGACVSGKADPCESQIQEEMT